MDIDNYENPFASSEKEIGQMDVAVEEEELVRESIRKIILEANGFGCNNHSLGFIDPEGNFIDLSETEDDHNSWMETYQSVELGVDRYPMGQIPENWIKVSNANEFWFAAKDWNEMTFAQFEGLVDMWSSCKRHSKWLQGDVEGFHVTFGLSDPDPFGFSEHMEQYTIPEFIDKFVGRRGEDLFYGMLLGEL